MMNEANSMNTKGRVGDFEYGYVAREGERNVWIVRDRRNGETFRVREQSLNGAFNAARHENAHK